MPTPYLDYYGQEILPYGARRRPRGPMVPMVPAAPAPVPMAPPMAPQPPSAPTLPGRSRPMSPQFANSALGQQRAAAAGLPAPAIPAGAAVPAGAAPAIPMTGAARAADAQMAGAALQKAAFIGAPRVPYRGGGTAYARLEDGTEVERSYGPRPAIPLDPQTEATRQASAQGQRMIADAVMVPYGATPSYDQSRAMGDAAVATAQARVPYVAPMEQAQVNQANSNVGLTDATAGLTNAQAGAVTQAGQMTPETFKAMQQENQRLMSLLQRYQAGEQSGQMQQSRLQLDQQREQRLAGEAQATQQNRAAQLEQNVRNRDMSRRESMARSLVERGMSPEDALREADAALGLTGSPTTRPAGRPQNGVVPGQGQGPPPGAPTASRVRPDGAVERVYHDGQQWVRYQ
jgi:hypothetical protein